MASSGASATPKRKGKRAAAPQECFNVKDHVADHFILPVESLKIDWSPTHYSFHPILVLLATGIPFHDVQLPCQMFLE